MTFLDCPAYLDEDGARRCGLPAEVRCRFVLRCSDGPLEAAMIRCPSGHWFNGPIESLAWESQDTHHPGKAEVTPSATDRFQEGPGGGSPVRPAANSPRPGPGSLRATPALTVGAGPSSGITPRSRGGLLGAPTPLLPTTWGDLPASG